MTFGQYLYSCGFSIHKIQKASVSFVNRLMEHIIKGGGYEGTPLDENALRIEPEHLAMDELTIQGKT